MSSKVSGIKDGLSVCFNQEGISSEGGVIHQVGNYFKRANMKNFTILEKDMFLDVSFYR